MKRTLAALLTAALATPALAQDAGDIRDLFRAPPRFKVHDGAKVGDWLERATSTRLLTTKQKTTIVGVDRDCWVIGRTSSFPARREQLISYCGRRV